MNNFEIPLILHMTFNDIELRLALYWIVYFTDKFIQSKIKH